MITEQMRADALAVWAYLLVMLLAEILAVNQAHEHGRKDGLDQACTYRPEPKP
jgi:hypothetical protein